MRVLRIEPFSGIAGDMFVAAATQLVQDDAAQADLPQEQADPPQSLVDPPRALADLPRVLVDLPRALADLPQALGLEGVELRWTTVDRGGLEARRLEVLVGGEPAERAAGSHSHRHLSELLDFVDRADLSASVRRQAGALLRRLGEAEAAVHGVPLDRVHLHEAGGIDSLIDIVATAWLIDRLAVDQVVCEAVCTGFGTVHTAHGELPIPAPATERLLRGMPTVAGELEGEMTTPTGATILAALEPQFERPPLRVVATAYGAGSRNLAGRPNVLRLTLCDTVDPAVEPDPGATDSEASPALPATGGLAVNVQSAAAAETDEGIEDLVLLTTTVDDMSGELFGDHLSAALLGRGALDAILRPVIGKKGRPGVEVEVLCPPESRADLTDYLLENTSTLGVRWHRVRRRALKRDRVEVETRFGAIGAKRARLPSGRLRVVPEFEDCRVAAERADVPVLEVYRAALSAAVDHDGEEHSE